MRAWRALLLVGLFPLAHVEASTFTVTNVNDSGAGSLRQAILNANANTGPDLIDFKIGGPGPYTIALQSGLTITDPVVIDATTQGGFAGTPIVELNGVIVTSSPGLTITAGSTTIRGLVINSKLCGICSRTHGG